MKKLFLCLPLLLVAAVGNAASIIPTLVGGPTAVGGGLFVYNYDAQLSGSSQINTADNPAFLTFDDFAGFDHATGPSGSWVVNTMLTGGNGFLTAPTDSPTLLNVQFMYTSMTVILGAADLGVFQVYSAIGNIDAFRQYSAQDTSIITPHEQGNVGFVPGPEAPVNTPELGTFVLVGAALGMLAWRKKGGLLIAS